ncbi:two-component system, OmpR family, phosphate regulon response regulator PhoB [Lebetimonas natsushimae]|uniref:Two-component system, OmpR family, phosphate regulon response regulator PhoB n=1 Tax=Lebetimonas natsushimae TaxID=1936991 RepID=A0A292YEY6_9BACT|nr:response regulator transcription factor [Lebetimonas natsushimae]GAX87799.1 two-component system, OmpR family, phosphate regulon response regulator PhoB [Lebetimonas natsushimae]
MIKIAIIEDEEDLLDLLEFNLINAGFDAVGFLNTKKVKDFIIEENPDLLIVDRNLPGIEGSEFVKELKNEGFNIPVIFLTAKVGEEDILDGFEKGADDYIKKPFSIKELIARIKAVLKRYNKKINFLTYKNYKLDLLNKNLLIGNDTIDLTKSEFNLLNIFFENPKRIITKEEIADILEISEKSVNVAINRLNHKINLIDAKRGIGYTLK